MLTHLSDTKNKRNRRWVTLSDGSSMDQKQGALSEEEGALLGTTIDIRDGGKNF